MGRRNKQQPYNTMLSIKYLSAGYSKSNYILQDFSLKLMEGERIGIIGQNGCGKSTLAKAIMGITPEIQGKIIWENKINLLKTPTYARNNLGIAYFMQGGRVFGDLSVEDNLKITLYNNKKKANFKKAMLKLTELDLPLFKDSRRLRLRAMNLSGGEKHILGFAMVVLGCPNMKLLIADEPSAGVATIGQKQILKLMTQILTKNDTALLLIEQNRNFIKELTDKTVEIKIDKS